MIYIFKIMLFIVKRKLIIHYRSEEGTLFAKGAENLKNMTEACDFYKQ